MGSKSFGLSLLQCYSDDDENYSDTETEESKTEEVASFLQTRNAAPDLSTATEPTLSSAQLSYRENLVETSDSDDDSSSDESYPATPVHIDADEDEIDHALVDKKNAAVSKAKMLEDLGILDLAPLEDLKISVPEEECIPIGNIHSIIEPLVIVSAKKGCPAIDLDSVLFLDQGKKFLGQVFDVFGQVSEPMYMIRFNSQQDIIDQGIHVGMEVFFAPRTRHTAYVFVDALFKQKGSDASWENDQEPPEGCLDYSDDEEERRAKAAHRLKKNPRNTSEDQPCGPVKKRPAKFQRNNKGHRPPHLLHQTPVNPFYMLPPAVSTTSAPVNTNLTADDSPHASTTTSSSVTDSVPSAYTYPPDTQ